jgi:hypothetical protein
MPYSLASETSGNCTVIVRDDAEIGPPNGMLMTATGGPDDAGHIFGAGQGSIPEQYTFSGNSYPHRMALDDDGKSNWETISNEEDYLTFIETLGLATQTEVKIGGNAFIKGSVYGGAENGYVQHNTHVTIEGDCQIGNGYVQMKDNGEYLAEPYSLNRRYTPTEWAEGRLYKDGETNYTSSLPECASWPYGQAPILADRYTIYDKYYGTAG